MSKIIAYTWVICFSRSHRRLDCAGRHPESRGANRSSLCIPLLRHDLTCTDFSTVPIIRLCAQCFSSRFAWHAIMCAHVFHHHRRHHTFMPINTTRDPDRTGVRTNARAFCVNVKPAHSRPARIARSLVFLIARGCTRRECARASDKLHNHCPT